MYALGTFIGSITERTEHANTINHSIAIKLLATVSQDGSPLVRKVLIQVNILFTKIKGFDESFCIVFFIALKLKFPKNKNNNKKNQGLT